MLWLFCCYGQTLKAKICHDWIGELLQTSWRHFLSSAITIRGPTVNTVYCLIWLHSAGSERKAEDFFSKALSMYDIAWEIAIHLTSTTQFKARLAWMRLAPLQIPCYYLAQTKLLIRFCTNRHLKFRPWDKTVKIKRIKTKLLNHMSMSSNQSNWCVIFPSCKLYLITRKMKKIWIAKSKNL